MCVCRLNLELRNNSSETALWLALKDLDTSYLRSTDLTEHEHTFAARLILRGSNINAVDNRSGNSTLHDAILDSKEAAAVFLLHKGALPNNKNSKGEAPIHLAAMNGLETLVGVLLECGADPNQQTALKPRPPIHETPPISRQDSLTTPTPLEAYSAQVSTRVCVWCVYCVHCVGGQWLLVLPELTPTHSTLTTITLQAS